MSKLIITIDGPAASGKSTIARTLAQKLGIAFLDTGAMQVFIDGRDVTDRLRSPRVTANAGDIASTYGLRRKLTKMQRDFAGEHKKLVTEGRDQGTAVFPDADYKFFLTAGIDERTRRRQAQLQAEGCSDSFDEIRTAIIERDESDRNRKIGPLKKAPDAVELNTTNMSTKQVLNKLLGYIHAE